MSKNSGRPSVDKLVFVVSLLVFAFIYGIATQAFGWFPSSLVQRAWNQAEAVSPLSTEFFTSEGPPGWTTERVYSRTGVAIADSGDLQRGLTLLESHWRGFGWTNGLKLIDQQGETVHEWPVPAAKIFPDPPRDHVRRDPATSIIHGSYLFPNGDVLVNIEYVGTVRLDACGRVKWKLAEGSHHSIARAEDGSFWISAQTFEPLSVEGEDNRYPGLRPVHWDRIVRVSEEGQILQDYRALDIVFDNGLEQHIPASSWHTAGEIDTTDILHLNDVEPLPDSLADEYPLFTAGDLLVSLNHVDLVFVFDPDSGRVLWHVAGPSVIGQHDPDFIGDGWIGVFDNRRDGTRRGRLLGGSRVVAFQPHTDSTEVLFPNEGSKPFHTGTQGLWQLLNNGNMLLTETQAGRVVEVGADGRTVWEWVAEPYGQGRVPEVNGATRYDITEEQAETWPCSPEERRNDPEAVLQ